MSPLRPIRLSTRTAAPEGTGRDGTDGTRGRGGQRGARGQGARSSRPRQRATGPAELSPGREGGRRGRVSGEKRAHAHPSPSGELSSPPSFTRAPSGVREGLVLARWTQAADPESGLGSVGGGGCAAVLPAPCRSAASSEARFSRTTLSRVSTCVPSVAMSSSPAAPSTHTHPHGRRSLRPSMLTVWPSGQSTIGLEP